MNNYIIVIPTYKRHKHIWQKGTLKFLQKYKIPKNKIVLFVANKTEKKIYERSIPKNMYSGEIVVGKKGINNQRKFIAKYYPEGKYIISIDDDIEDILIKVNSKKLESIGKQGLVNLFNDSYKLMKKNNAFIWGINVVSNPFMMQDKISINLGIIPAGFYGFINRHNVLNKINNDTREDIERSIIYFNKDDIILRYMYITFKTNMKTFEGGIQANVNTKRREELEDKATIELKKDILNNAVSINQVV